MKRALLLLLILLFPVTLFAAERDDCRNAAELAALYQVRSILLRSSASSSDAERVIDRNLEILREPLPGGGYRWVHWVRPEGDPPYDKKGHNVGAVHEAGSPDSFEAAAEHVFAVRVAVPQKRSLFRGNSRVYVGTLHLSYTAGGRTRTKDERIEQWMNPDTSRSVDLGTIADHVEGSLDASTDQKNAGEALVELHFKQAVPQDDPGNPSYGAIQTLKRVRRNPEAVDTEIASIERDLLPGTESLPLVSIVRDLRRAQDLIRSSKPADQEKGEKLLKEALRQLH